MAGHSKWSKIHRLSIFQLYSIAILWYANGHWTGVKVLLTEFSKLNEISLRKSEQSGNGSMSRRFENGCQFSKVVVHYEIGCRKLY